MSKDKAFLARGAAEQIKHRFSRGEKRVVVVVALVQRQDWLLNSRPKLNWSTEKS